MEPAQHAIPGTLGALLRTQPDSKGRTALAWRVVAGAAMARATTVRLDERGTLWVRAADTHWRTEIERGRDVLVARLQGLLGPGVISGLRLE